MTRPTLCPREQQILELLAEGYEAPDIAAALFISQGTVKTWKGRLYEKLGAHGAANAVHLAHEAGLLGSYRPELQATAEDLALVQQARELGCRIALVPVGEGVR